MIVKNEENLIEDCILSVLPIASEIIVVDNGSTDNTIKILEKYHCIIIEAKNLVLDLARDSYLKKAKYPWILVIDADERLAKIDKKMVYNYLNSTLEQIWAFSIKIYQYIGEGKWALTDMLRLFRNNHIVMYNNSEIHATILPSIITNGGKISSIPLYFHHIDILEKERTLMKRERYKNLLKDKISDKYFMRNDENSYYLYKIFLGLEYVAIKDFDNSECLFLDVIKNNKMFYDFASISLCRLYILQKKYNKILDYFTLEDICLNNINNESFYNIVDILANYYYIYDKQITLNIYNKLCSYSIERVSDLLNKSFLIKDSNFKEGKNLLVLAFNKNSYLKKKIIYKEGKTPNLFNQQSCFLQEIPNIMNLINFYGLENLISE
jgi:glycosyltransferase involved in cell wall biosynthesis